MGYSTQPKTAKWHWMLECFDSFLASVSKQIGRRWDSVDVVMSPQTQALTFYFRRDIEPIKQSALPVSVFELEQAPLMSDSFISA
jgi:uncharacterized membrane protein